jgi:hypothetical protein
LYFTSTSTLCINITLLTDPIAGARDPCAPRQSHRATTHCASVEPAAAGDGRYR